MARRRGGQGMSMDELFKHKADGLELALRELEKSVSHSFGRDAICERLSDCHVALLQLAEETNRIARQAGSGRVRRAPLREEKAQVEVVGDDGRDELAMDAFDVTELERDDEPGADDPLSPWSLELAGLVQGLDMEDGARIIQERVAAVRKRARLATVKGVIRMFWFGAPNPWEMMRNGVAITRRYVLKMIPGMTVTEVAKFLDQTKQAVSLREAKKHDEYLERWGVRNPKAADPGLKSKAACASYKESNGKTQSRKRGERRKKLRKAFENTDSRRRESVS